jgi:hypothetical protein
MRRLLRALHPHRFRPMLPSFLTADPIPRWATQVAVLVGGTLLLLVIAL